MTHYTSCSKCNTITLHEVSGMNSQGKKIQTCTSCRGESVRKTIAERALEEEKRARRYEDKTYQDVVDSIYRERGD